MRTPAAGRRRRAVAGDNQTVLARLQADRPGATILNVGKDTGRAELHDLHPAAVPEDRPGALEVLACPFPQGVRFDEIGDRWHRSRVSPARRGRSKNERAGHDVDQ